MKQISDVGSVIADLTEAQAKLLRYIDGCGPFDGRGFTQTGVVHETLAELHRCGLVSCDAELGWSTTAEGRRVAEQIRKQRAERKRNDFIKRHYAALDADPDQAIERRIYR